MPIMARRATMIIAPSEWKRREIVEQLRISPEKIRVIYEAAREGMKPLPWRLCLERSRQTSDTPPVPALRRDD